MKRLLIALLFLVLAPMPALAAQVGKLKVTVLSTMMADQGIGEWGYAALVEVDGRKILYDTGASHSSGMNNWEVFRARLEGNEGVALALEGVRRAAVAMAAAAEKEDFEAMGLALGEEWVARRRLAPVVSTPSIEAAIEAARRAGAWAGKACGAGGGGCVVFLAPATCRDDVIEALAGLGRGSVLEVAVENRGLVVGG